MSIRSELAAEAGREMARKQEGLLGKALCEFVGRDVTEDEVMEWALDGRLSRRTYQHAPQAGEEWCLDGQPFLVTYPFEFSTRQEGDRIMQAITQNYRIVGRPTKI